MKNPFKKNRYIEVADEENQRGANRHPILEKASLLLFSELRSLNLLEDGEMLTISIGEQQATVIAEAN